MSFPLKAVVLLANISVNWPHGHILHGGLRVAFFLFGKVLFWPVAADQEFSIGEYFCYRERQFTRWKRTFLVQAAVLLSKRLLSTYV